MGKLQFYFYKTLDSNVYVLLYFHIVQFLLLFKILGYLFIWTAVKFWILLVTKLYVHCSKHF